MNRKLTVPDSELLAMREQGMSNEQIAAKFGVTSKTILNHIGKQPGTSNYGKKPVTPSVKEEMLALREQGLDNAEISKKMGLHKCTVLKYIGKQPKALDKRGGKREKAKAPAQEPQPTPVETPQEPQPVTVKPPVVEVAAKAPTPVKRPKAPLTDDLFQFAYIPDWGEALRQLAAQALKEPWKFKETQKVYKHPDTVILESYIHQMFRFRVAEYNNASEEEQDKIIYMQGGLCCFHVGLYTLSMKDIYAVFRANNVRGASQPWVLMGFFEPNARELRRISPLPEHRRLGSDTSREFDPNKPLRVNTEHILLSRVDRLPQSMLESWNANLLLETALELSRRLARVSPQVAVPTHRIDQTSYLLPLYITNADKPDVAAVLEDEGDYYHCRTCLTLQQAYLSARVTAKPLIQWLTDLV